MEPKIKFAVGDQRLPIRFWSKVSPNASGCWLWTAALRSDGYGQLTLNKKGRSAHRLAYEALVAKIPSGLELDHLCRERRCCNPAHLEPVTRQENVRRGLRGVLHTHCPHGHEFTPANTAINNRGHRYCRQCSRDSYQHVDPEQDKRRILKSVCKRGHALELTARATTKGRKCQECSNQLQRERRATARTSDRDLLGA